LQGFLLGNLGLGSISVVACGDEKTEAEGFDLVVELLVQKEYVESAA
jgi:hypothetical protein